MLLLKASTSFPFLFTKVQRQKINLQFIHSACRRDEFTCADGTCVPQSAKCNRQFECPDRSDEDDCQQRCRPGEYQCNTGECISASRKCDRKIDCQDGSDENDCSKLINLSNHVYVAKFCSCRKIYLMSQKYFDLITIGITLSFDHRMIFWTIHSNHNQHTQPHTGLTLRRPARPVHTFRQCSGHRRMNALTVQEANGNVGQVNAFHSRHTVTGNRIAVTIPMKESAVSLSHITHLLSMFTHPLCSPVSPVCHFITIHTYFD